MLKGTHHGKFGAQKAILPALLVGGAAFFASSQLHGDGGLAAGVNQQQRRGQQGAWASRAAWSSSRSPPGSWTMAS